MPVFDAILRIGFCMLLAFPTDENVINFHRLILTGRSRFFSFLVSGNSSIITQMSTVECLFALLLFVLCGCC